MKKKPETAKLVSNFFLHNFIHNILHYTRYPLPNYYGIQLHLALRYTRICMNYRNTSTFNWMIFSFIVIDQLAFKWTYEWTLGTKILHLYSTQIEIKLSNNYQIIYYWFLALFTDDVLASNAFIFFAAGFETTASTISYCLYELALNPNIQVELREQINKTLYANDGKLTYNVINDMKYLDMILNGEK